MRKASIKEVINGNDDENYVTPRSLKKVMASGGGGGVSFDDIYPVGSIYFSNNSTNPSVYFGGTWQLHYPGRTLVCVDTGQTEFNTIGKIGGTKTHNHTSAAHTHTAPNHRHTGPSHTHKGPSHTHGRGNLVAAIALTSSYIYSRYEYTPTISGWTRNARKTVSGTNVGSTAGMTEGTPVYGTTSSGGTGNTGAGGTGYTSYAGNTATTSTTPGATGSTGTLMPYATCYVWLRTA